MSSERQSYDRQRGDRGQVRQKKKRFKYCCRRCKHTEGSKKSCVCVVPRSQRRTQIGDRGCQTCGCKGCSVEDYTYRGEDPEYMPRHSHSNRGQLDYEDERFDRKNGCCRKCMKAFSKTGKSCLCQVPKQVRKTSLPVEGCKICACTGCNPRDYSQQVSNSSNSQSMQSVEYSDYNKQEMVLDMRLNNIDESVLGKMIIMEYSLFPGMLGLGIPQRTPNYILGKPL